MAERVLVVGGAGYIGSHCVRALQQRGDEVVVFDDLSTGHREALDCELMEGDVRDEGALVGVLRSRSFDGVMHFAARALVGESTRAPSLYLDVNVGGTITLARAMIRSGVGRLVFSSSCSIYGQAQTTPVREDHPKAPESPYGLSKWMAEQALDSIREGEGLHVTSLRYFNAAGASLDGRLGESHDPETHLIPLALDARLGRRPPLTVFGRDYPTPDGTCIRDYIHVLDLADAHLAALDHLTDSTGGAWNLGTGQGSSVLEVLDAIERVTGAPVPYVDGQRRSGDPPAVWAAVDAAREELGVKPRHPGIEQIVETAWTWAQAPRY